MFQVRCSRNSRHENAGTPELLQQQVLSLRVFTLYDCFVHFGFRRPGVARFTLVMTAAQFIPLAAIFINNLRYVTSDSVPNPMTTGIVPALIIWLFDPLPHVAFPRYPSTSATWVGIIALTVIELLYLTAALHLSWNYYNLLFYGGTGWETKHHDDLYGLNDGEDEDFTHQYDESRRLV